MSKNKNSAFQMIADVEGDLEDILNVEVPDNVPILPVRNLVLFPGVVSPILIGRDSSKIVIQKAEKRGDFIGIVHCPMVISQLLYSVITDSSSTGSHRHLLIWRVMWSNILIWTRIREIVSSRLPWKTCVVLSMSISM